MPSFKQSDLKKVDLSQSTKDIAALKKKSKQVNSFMAEVKKDQAKETKLVKKMKKLD